MKWILIGIVVLVMLLFVLMTLGRRSPRQAVQLPADDPRMLGAVQQAQATAGDFLARLHNPTPGQTSAAVKIRLEEAGLVEHVWLAEPRFEDGEFIGRLDNDLIEIRRWRAGETLRVPLDQMSDWLVIDSGKLVGGYSIRLLRSLMSPDGQRSFDRNARYVIEN